MARAVLRRQDFSKGASLRIVGEADFMRMVSLDADRDPQPQQ
jgi:hypothetical protein